MILKKGHSIELPTMTTIHGVAVNTNESGSFRRYFSFLHNIDCLLCNVHIFNIAFEADKYLHDNSEVIFVLDSRPKDVTDFIKEHPNFHFNIVIDESKKLFNQVGLPKTKKSFLGFKKESFHMLDLILDMHEVVNLKYYDVDKNHLEYSIISNFLMS